MIPGDALKEVVQGAGEIIGFDLDPSNAEAQARGASVQAEADIPGNGVREIKVAPVAVPLSRGIGRFPGPPSTETCTSNWRASEAAPPSG